MSKETYPPEFLKLLKSVKAKRPKTVIDHILKYGQITTEELKDRYGYNHPPRAMSGKKGFQLEHFALPEKMVEKSQPINLATHQKYGLLNYLVEQLFHPS